MKTNTTIETAEHILPGHPDKLCDAAVDGIVEVLRKLDPEAQCGLEMACVFNHVFITGRIAANDQSLSEFGAQGGCEMQVLKSFKNAGYRVDSSGRPWSPLTIDLKVIESLCIGPFEEGERELRHLSDDQAICVGYANSIEETNHLPPAVWLSRSIAGELVSLRGEIASGDAGPDGKVLVRVEKNGSAWKPLHVSLSLSHHEESDWLRLRRFGEAAVEKACRGLPTPKVTLNAAGMFVSVGPNGDNGLSGKKLVCDAYGPKIPIGGGAWSGKDLHKVDRLGGLLARKLAKRIILGGSAGEALVFLEYHPGGQRPASVQIALDGQGPKHGIEDLLPDVSTENKVVWEDFSRCQIPLPELALWGHQQPHTPRENCAS